MSNPQLHQQLSVVLSSTYALYLKTQNYHWHVSGENFKSLHETFEENYQDLAELIDVLAERIVTLKGQAPATFSEFQSLSVLKEGDATQNSQTMIRTLESDHNTLAKEIMKAIEIAKTANDEGSIQVLGEQLAAHEKMAWMLRASEV